MANTFRTILVTLLLLTTKNVISTEIESSLLKKSADYYGYKAPQDVNSIYNARKSILGEKFFKDKNLSLNGGTSCQTCHLDEFSSADGIPNAIGIDGEGHGPERIKNQSGAIVPRNTIELWGRGGKNFKAFFWDGRVSIYQNKIFTPFGNHNPSDDLLTLAVHLPFLEIREFIREDDDIKSNYKKENVGRALVLYKKITEKVIQDLQYKSEIMNIYKVNEKDINFSHIADPLSHFIRDKFKIRDYKFSRFLKGQISLSENELKGGLLFYGKAKCAICHNGAYYSNFKYYSIPFPQAGFGKDGFGIDYGRFNVTHDTDDLYKFRVPPLLNVSQTKPYSHSGSIYSLKDVIIYHFDPLRLIDQENFTDLERVEYTKRLRLSNAVYNMSYLDDDEIDNLISFLKTLDFEK